MKSRKEIRQETLTAFVKISDIKDSVQEQKFEISNKHAKIIDKKFKNVVSLMSEIYDVLDIKSRE